MLQCLLCNLTPVRVVLTGTPDMHSISVTEILLATDIIEDSSQDFTVAGIVAGNGLLHGASRAACRAQ